MRFVQEHRIRVGLVVDVVDEPQREDVRTMTVRHVSRRGRLQVVLGDASGTAVATRYGDWRIDGRSVSLVHVRSSIGTRR